MGTRHSAPFIHFMLSVIAQALSQNASVNASVNAPVNIVGLKTPEAIMRLIQHNPQMTRQQIADTLGKDVRTIGCAIAKLQQVNRLRRIGSDKSGHWQIQEDSDA